MRVSVPKRKGKPTTDQRSSAAISGKGVGVGVAFGLGSGFGLANC
jgi:hypothetical protein